MNFKKLTATALAAICLVTPFTAFANPVPGDIVGTDESEATVGFVRGNIEIPNGRGGMLLVPHFDFGINQITPGRYILNALPSRQRVFEALPEGHTFTDDILPNVATNVALTGVTVTNATDHAHFIEVNDWTGEALGWRINVTRTEFFTAEAWAAAPANTVPIPTPAASADTDNFLRGAELVFNNIHAFPIGGGNAPTEFAGTNLLVPTESAVTFISTLTDTNQGMGAHRVQFGNRTTAALADAALADRANLTLDRNTDVQLLIPANAQVTPTRYTAGLTWNLVLGPGAVQGNTTLPGWAQPELVE